MKTPNTRKFATSKLSNWRTLSDESIVNSFGRRYMWFWSYSSIAKKWETIRKELWRLKREWYLEETMRLTRKGNSEEIFYRLR